MRILHSKTAMVLCNGAQNSALNKWKIGVQEMEILCSKMEILCSENGKFPNAMKNNCIKQTLQNSALRKWKFHTNKSKFYTQV